MPALRSRLCTRRTPPAASTSTWSRDDRRRNSLERGLGQGPRDWRRGRRHRARRPARRSFLEFLQLCLRDRPVHAPMPPSFPLLLDMQPAEHVASRHWRTLALLTPAVRPHTSQTSRSIDRVRRETTPVVWVRERRPRARLNSSRRLVRSRGARARASAVVSVARGPRGWRGPSALPALARRRLRRPRSGRRGASAGVPAARATPLARWLAPRRFLASGRTRRRRRRGRGTGGSTAAAVAAAALRRPRRARARRRPRRPRRCPALRRPRRPRLRLRLPRGGSRGASAGVPAARPTPLARGLAPRRLLPSGRSRRRRRHGGATRGSPAAAAAAAPR